MKNQKHFLGQQEMENAWNEYLKLERDVEQLKQTLQEQHRRAFFFQVTQGFFIPLSSDFFLESSPVGDVSPTQGPSLFAPGLSLLTTPRAPLGNPCPSQAVVRSLASAPPASLLSKTSSWAFF